MWPQHWTVRTAELTCNHSVDTFIQQRHGRGTGRGQPSRKQKRHHALLSIYASGHVSLLSKRGWSHLCIRFVRGSISFFPNRGSSGVSAPNCDTSKDAFSPRFLRNQKFSHSFMELLEYQKCQSRIVLTKGIPWSLLTYQFNDLYEDPVIGGWGHELEEKWGQRQIVLRVSPSQLADNIYCCRLHT